MPAPHEIFAAHLEDKSEMGAKPSTLRAAAAVLAHNQRHPRCYVPIHRDVPLVPNRVLLLDLDCYRVIRKAEHRPGSGRVGRMRRTGSACRRGYGGHRRIDIMEDASLKASKTAALARPEVERMRGLPGRVRIRSVKEDSYKVVSADTMKVLLTIRPGAGQDEPVLTMRPNQIAYG